MALVPDAKSFVVVTGASRGFGRAVSLALAERVGPHSLLLLLARDEEALVVTEASVRRVAPLVSVEKKKLDLSLAKDAEFQNLFLSCPNPRTFKQLIIVHNAGTVGDIGKNALDIRDPVEVDEYFRVNLSSVVAINSAFLAYAGDHPNRIVVQISSLCGFKPFKSMGLYCAGKAARNMFFRVLASEEPNVRVLSWSPGPLEGTDMSVKVRTECGDLETRQLFEEINKTNSYVSCQCSAEKMVATLILNEFVSGQNIDFFD